MSSLEGWLGRNVPDHVMEEAASWMALLDSGDCNMADRLSFSQWLGEDPIHQSAFEELSEVWARLHTLTDTQYVSERPHVVNFPVPERAVRSAVPVPKQRSRPEWSTLAAALLVVAGVCMHWAFGARIDLHETSVGEIQVIELTDGSRVELNARSSVEVQMDERRRELRLRDGEAVFHVQPDGRPFVVRTDLAIVSAVGTRFSVRAEGPIVEVSVIEGLVSVSANKIGTPLTEYENDMPMRFTDEVALLGAGQRLQITRESQRFETVPESLIHDDLSWRNGEVVFADTPLLAALTEMRRYHGASIFIGDPLLNTLRISGRYSTNDMEPFLAELNNSYGLAIDRSSPHYTVLRLPTPAISTHAP